MFLLVISFSIFYILWGIKLFIYWWLLHSVLIFSKYTLLLLLLSIGVYTSVDSSSCKVYHLADFISSISCSSMSQARSITLCATVVWQCSPSSCLCCRFSQHFEEIPCKKLVMVKHLCEMKHTCVSSCLLIRGVFSRKTQLVLRSDSCARL